MFRLLFFLLVAIQICSASLSAGQSPGRAMWVVRYTLMDDYETTHLINTAKRLNLTDLYIQVRALGKFFNAPEQNSTDFKKTTAHKNFIKILKQAHKQNIRIHAWLNIFFVHQRTDSISNSDHFVHTEQDYVLRNAFADSFPTSYELKTAAVEGIYLDPINHKNYNYITNEIEYLVDSLEVDGIHLDYFRYPNHAYLFSPKGRAEFVVKNYVDPVIIYDNETQMDFELRSRLEKRYKDFLRNNLTEFLSGIQQTIKAKENKVTLSIAVKPDWQDAKNNYLQNWQEWLASGLCNQVVLMNYSIHDSVFYKNILKAVNLDMVDKIVIGVATYNQAKEPILKRLNWLNRNNFAGFALFSYNDILVKPDLIKNLENYLRN